jgi:hypothetical protein
MHDAAPWTGRRLELRLGQEEEGRIPVPRKEEIEQTAGRLRQCILIEEDDANWPATHLDRWTQERSSGTRRSDGIQSAFDELCAKESARPVVRHHEQNPRRCVWYEHGRGFPGSLHPAWSLRRRQ